MSCVERIEGVWRVIYKGQVLAKRCISRQDADRYLQRLGAGLVRPELIHSSLRFSD